MKSLCFIFFFAFAKTTTSFTPSLLLFSSTKTYSQDGYVYQTTVFERKTASRIQSRRSKSSPMMLRQSSNNDGSTEMLSTSTPPPESSSSNNINDETSYDQMDTEIISKVQKHFNSNLLYTYILPEHKPLGCTAEESLAEGNNGEKFVFISKLVAGGNAATAGLMEGDLIVGVSGTFDSVEDVFGEGLDRVRSLVAGKPEDDELTIKIIRNTDVMQQHESALVDLCIIPEGQFSARDKNIETCIETMYKAGYEIDDTEGVQNSCEDEDVECMLDQMTDLWGDNDYDSESSSKKDESSADSKKENEVKKPAPWSSRSSPSGTWVRVNGKMTNIDE